MAARAEQQPTAVTIEPWFSLYWGLRFTAIHGGRSLATRGTEAEVRRLCAEHGWTVVDAESAPREGADGIMDGLADAEERACAAATGVERVELPEEVRAP